MIRQFALRVEWETVAVGVSFSEGPVALHFHRLIEVDHPDWSICDPPFQTWPTLDGFYTWVRRGDLEVIWV